MRFFQYGEKEINYLKQKDKLLGNKIVEIGLVKRQVNPDLFSALISSVIGQQISTKAAVTVEQRLIDLVETIEPEKVNQLAVEEIQKCGMPLRKASYIKGIAEAAMAKTIDFANLHLLSDEQVIKELSGLKGVGEWTAEMLLIHSLERQDILSYKDLGIRRGIIHLYGLEDLTKEQFNFYRNLYSPYGTIASIYLWEIGNNVK